MKNSAIRTFRLAAAILFAAIAPVAVAHPSAAEHARDLRAVFAGLEEDPFREVFETVSADIDNALARSFETEIGPIPGGPGNHRILGHSWALGDRIPKDKLRLLESAHPGRRADIVRWWNRFSEAEITKIAESTGLARTQAKSLGNIIWRIHLFGDRTVDNRAVDHVIPTRENAERLIRDLNDLFRRSCPDALRKAVQAIRDAMRSGETEAARATAALDACAEARIPAMLERGYGRQLASKGIGRSAQAASALPRTTVAGSVPSSATKLMARGRTFAANSPEGAKAWSAAKESFRSKGTVQVRPGILATSGRLLTSVKSGAAAGALVFAADAGMACYRYWQGDILDIELADGIADAALKGALVGAAVGVAVLLGATPQGWCVLAVATATYIIVDIGIRIWREIDERRFLSAEDLAAFGIRRDAFPEPRDSILSTRDDGFLEPRDSTFAIP